LIDPIVALVCRKRVPIRYSRFSYLFALYDVRILKAHKASERTQKLQGELKRFGIKPGQEGPGYGKILDHVCDALSGELGAIATKIEPAA
jgi:hypothetical protein